MKPEYLANGKQGPTEPPLDWARNLWNTRFLGVPAIQFHIELLVYERLFATAPLQGIVELGAAAGGLSLYFLLQSFQRDLLFATFDRDPIGACDTPLGRKLNLSQHTFIGDLWGDTGAEVIRLLTGEFHPLLLLCDNGNKPREFQTFVPYLRAGDIVGVHDWGNEFADGDIPASMRRMIEPYFWSECEDMGSLTRFWRRV